MIYKSDNAARLQELHRIIADEARIRELFERIFEEEQPEENEE